MVMVEDFAISYDIHEDSYRRDYRAYSRNWFISFHASVVKYVIFLYTGLYTA